MKERRATTSRTLRVTRQRELQGALEQVTLARDEELVLRMHHGIPAAHSTALSYRGTETPELAAKLAMIEADALQHIRPQATPDTSGEHLKRAIIDRLRDL